jgi:hypothetical protein
VLAPVTSGILAQAPRPNAGRAPFECTWGVMAPMARVAMGPGITMRIPLETDQELATLIGAGLPANGMPAFQLAGADLRRLIHAA